MCIQGIADSRHHSYVCLKKVLAGHKAHGSSIFWPGAQAKMQVIKQVTVAHANACVVHEIGAALLAALCKVDLVAMCMPSTILM